jgi:HEAT repeat protein
MKKIVRIPAAALLCLLAAACGAAGGGGTTHTVMPGTPLSPGAELAVREAQSGDPAKVRALLGWFATEDNERLIRVVTSLGPKAVAPMMEALDDPDPARAELAAGLLGELRAEEAVPKLTARLRSGLPRRYVAAWALGEIRNPGSVPVLVAALADPNESVVKASTRALINIGRKSTPAIVAALPASSGRPRKAMLRALEDIEDTRAEDVLLAVLDSEKDPVVQAAAARALSKCGTVKCYAPLERWLLEGETGVRVECAWSLGILIAKPAEGALRKTLEDPDPNVREWSARALENITGQRVLYRDAKGKKVLPYNLYR